MDLVPIFPLPFLSFHRVESSRVEPLKAEKFDPPTLDAKSTIRMIRIRIDHVHFTPYEADRVTSRPSE